MTTTTTTTVELPTCSSNVFTLQTRFEKKAKPITFKAYDYNAVEASQEAAKSGVWGISGLREDICPTDNLEVLRRPAAPLREGQGALFIASGMLNNSVLEDANGRKVMVKGRSIKEFVQKKVEKNDKEEVTAVTDREVIRTEIKALDLITGSVTEIEQTDLNAFLKSFKTSVRRQMLNSYPPKYMPAPGKEQPDEIARKMELGIGKLKRKPIGGQSLAIVGTAIELKEDGAAMLWSEQGTGKSLMGTAAGWLLGAKRVIVICPPHLVYKWKREIENTITGAKAEVVEARQEKGRKKTAIEVLEEIAGNHDPKHRVIGRIEIHERVMKEAGFVGGVGVDAAPPYFVIMSDTTAKLAPHWKPSVNWKTIKDAEDIAVKVPICPQCGQTIVHSEIKQKDEPYTLEELSKKKFTCQNKINFWKHEKGSTKEYKNVRLERVCKAPLWQVNAKKVWDDPSQYKQDGYPVITDWFTPNDGPGDGPRKLPLAKMISMKYKDFFDLAILDEAHVHKDLNSAQGVAAGIIASSCKYVLAMSGTLSGGKASDLFFLLYRFNKKFRKQYKLSDKEKWINKYGVLERKTYAGKNSRFADRTADGAGSLRRETAKEIYTEKPGMTPKILEMLIEHTIFLKIKDVGKDLPTYHEYVDFFEMEPDHEAEYKAFERKLTDAVRETLVVEGSQRLLGAMGSLLSWPDNPTQDRIIIDPKYKCEILRANKLPENVLYPKEKWLIEKYKTEKALGRKMIIFISDTKTNDITGRLKWVLEEAQASQGVKAKVAVLKSESVESKKREEWIEKKLKEEIDVLIVHPRCVQTGLDLLAFPTIIFYQIEYSIYVQMQAERRSWRLGQKQPVQVHYLIYRPTAQTKAIKLQAKKKRTVLMLGGDLEQGGMMALGSEEDAEDSLFMDIARSLVRPKTELADGVQQIAEGKRVESDDDDDENDFSLEKVLESMNEVEQEAASFVLGDEEMTAEEAEAAIEKIYFQYQNDTKLVSEDATLEEKAFIAVATEKPKVTLESMKEKLLAMKAEKDAKRKKPLAEPKPKEAPAGQLSMFDMFS